MKRANLDVKKKNSREVLRTLIFTRQETKMTRPHAFLNAALVTTNPVEKAPPGSKPVEGTNVCLGWKLANIKNINVLSLVVNFSSLNQQRLILKFI